MARDVNRTRTQIAFAVIVVGAIGITAISITALIFAADKSAVAQLVFSSVLPLLGTWVGAVLAFYFSRDNLQAASQTTLDAVRAAGGIDAATKVTAIMTRLERMRPREEVADQAAADAIPLANIHAAMQSSGYSRIPVIVATKDSAGALTKAVALYVVHDTDIDKFAQSGGGGGPRLPSSFAAADTVGALVTLPGVDPSVKTFAFVKADATVAEARTALSKVRDAKDLFVTDTGDATGGVVGWLTNSDLARSL